MQRLMRDFKRLRDDPPQGVNGSPKNDSIMRWNAVIFGPDDTPWDGGNPHTPELLHRYCRPMMHSTPFAAGTFKLILEFSEEYPNKAPVVKFKSTMFHPNSRSSSCHLDAAAGLPPSFVRALPSACIASSGVTTAVYADGGICLDILQNQWSPIYDVSAILTSIQVVKCAPVRP